MATINQSGIYPLPGHCVNFTLPDKCNEWIMDKFEQKDFKGEENYSLTTPNFKKAQQICSKCPNFKPSK